MNKYEQDVGKQKRIMVANVTYFRGNGFKEMCRKKGIIISYISIRYPVTIPAERYIKEVVRITDIKRP